MNTELAVSDEDEPDGYDAGKSTFQIDGIEEQLAVHVLRGEVSAARLKYRNLLAAFVEIVLRESAIGSGARECSQRGFFTDQFLSRGFNMGRAKRMFAA